MSNPIKSLVNLLKTAAKEPRVFARLLNTFPFGCGGCAFAHSYKDKIGEADAPAPSSENPLWDYFQNHKEGPGIWKWEHYFDIYHRYFSRFVGKKVNVLEIGIYSGGSLPMWRSYFGEDSHIYGVDIEDACKSYQSDHVSVFIGDQADRGFWRSFRNEVDEIDIIIDDGGHTPEQQRITLEEMLSHLSPGGVYLCEDIQGRYNEFNAFAASLVHELSAADPTGSALLQNHASPFQSSIYSIHFYPYVLVIEKRHAPIENLTAPKHGTEWQPFL